MKTILILIFSLLPSFHQIKAQQRPSWHFNLIVGISEETVNHYGGFKETKNLVYTQIQTVNARFNQVVFAGEIQFIIDSVYVFNNDPVGEAFIPHPDHSYRVIYHCIQRPGGGWYGPPKNAICHIWPEDKWGGTFGLDATDGIIHEFGHSRGAIDVYALKVNADNNPISGQEYKPPTSIMNETYGVTIWDTHSVNLINQKADSVNKTAKYITTAFPPSIIIITIGNNETPLPDTRINLYPVDWYSYTVNTTPCITVQTNELGEFTFTRDANPFEPDTEGKPWKIKYPNFLVEARLESIVAYQWMPLIDVQNYYFSNPGKPYKLIFDLEAMSAIENYTSKPEHFWVRQNYPNPFNTETTIEYQLPKTAEASIKIYNMKGQLVQSLIDHRQFAGYNSVIWNGKDHCGKAVSTGVYLGEFQAGKYHQTIRMLLLK